MPRKDCLLWPLSHGNHYHWQCACVEFMPDHWRSYLRCVAPAPVAAVAVVAVPCQLHSGASIRVPCDPFLQDHGRLLRLLLGIGWTVLRVHVWRHMLEHPDLVPR